MIGIVGRVVVVRILEVDKDCPTSAASGLGQSQFEALYWYWALPGHSLPAAVR